MSRRAMCAWALVIVLAPQVVAQVAIGHWRDHFPYRRAMAVVEGGGKVYCATNNAVFSFDPQDHGMERMTKVNVLSDVNIRSIGWSADLGALLVGYSNGNLDMVRNGRADNLGDIKRSSLMGDKGIYNIVCRDGQAYLCCGFGIVQMDLQRREVRDTWMIGPNASQVQVNDLVFHGDSIYAATAKGLFSAWRGNPNLAAFTSWRKRMDIPRPNGPFTAAVSFNGRLMVNFRLSNDQQRDTVFYWDGAWQRFGSVYDNRNLSLKVSQDGHRLMVTHLNTFHEFDEGLSQTMFADRVGGVSWPRAW
ncbi:MAG: hypothetical protein QM724_03100 [Flavobacteriales bacterium]